MTTGRFADIRVEADSTAEGKLALSFVTTPNYFVGEVRWKAHPTVPRAGQIVNASKLSLGELFSNEKMDQALANIKQLAEENGYYRSSVTPEEKQDATTQQIAIVFHFNPGVQARVGTVSGELRSGVFPEGYSGYSQAAPGRSGFCARASSALERLRKKYQKQNRLLSQVLIAKKSYRADANAVDYTLQITPGPKVVIEAEGFKIKRGS